ncbi:MAG: VWA domain-containing protein, partial [Anaerolineae bacterium]|nr:VWA domain-containing protein [Anaerolineae bacterium]
MSFTTPLGLVLLIALPIVIYLGWPRLPYRRRRDLTSLILRVIILLLLVFSLAGVQTVQSADRLAVVFLLDVSDSMTARAREAGLDYIRQSLAAMRPDDRAALVLFGGSALIERPLSSVRELPLIQSAPPSGSTDLEEAIRLALGMFPADAARRIVILSDGRETIGEAASAAELAAATGVEISYVLYRPDNTLEVQVTDVTVPATINAGQTFDLSLTIQAESATPANITVLESGQIIHREAVDLRQGSNRYTLTLQAVGSGFKDFLVQVDPAGNDSFYQNNQLSAFSRVVGPPRVLVLYTDPLEITYLLPALQQAGISVDTATPEQLPVGLVPLAQYESIVMVDVPATALTPQRMEAIQSFVRDLGGGLVAIGGPQSYGPGGYFQTPLEETLPLDSQVKDQQRLPQLTIAYVIDRSGSMGTVGPSGVENIELAKEAIIRSVDFLQPTDRAGVVSFDTVGYWIANVQPVRDRVGLQRLVATLRTGGGTDILAGMNIIAPVMAEDPSARKHIILLTDGGANPEGLVELTTQLNTQGGVTTSVIAIGAGAAPFLEDMAKAGGGNYHAVERVEQIPAIFSQETVLATRSYILEDPFVPILTASSPILDGIAAAP